MAKRIAPKKGYDFAEKAEYRENVWRVFSENVHDVSTAKVAFMPSKEGLEIPVALSYGFKEENLFAIDENPAILACAKWRKKYPKIHIYGSEISRAGQRIVEDGYKLHAVNLDLCGKIGVPMFNSVNGFINSGALSGQYLISVTAFKGREDREIFSMLELIADFSGGKITREMNRACILTSMALGGHEETSREELFNDEYLSSTIYMQYSISRVVINNNNTSYHTKRIEELFYEKLSAMVGEIESCLKKNNNHGLGNKGFKTSHDHYPFFNLKDDSPCPKDRCKGLFTLHGSPITDDDAMNVYLKCRDLQDRIFELQTQILQCVYDNTHYFNYHLAAINNAREFMEEERKGSDARYLCNYPDPYKMSDDEVIKYCNDNYITPLVGEYLVPPHLGIDYDWTIDRAGGWKKALLYSLNVSFDQRASCSKSYGNHKKDLLGKMETSVVFNRIYDFNRI